MFNNDKIDKIDALNRRCRYIEDELTRYAEWNKKMRVQQQEDFEKLLNHLGLTFLDINERRLVSTKTSEGGA